MTFAQVRTLEISIHVSHDRSGHAGNKHPQWSHLRYRSLCDSRSWHKSCRSSAVRPPGHNDSEVTVTTWNFPKETFNAVSSVAVFCTGLNETSVAKIAVARQFSVRDRIFGRDCIRRLSSTSAHKTSKWVVNGWRL